MREKEITRTLQLVRAQKKPDQGQQIRRGVVPPIGELSVITILSKAARHKNIIFSMVSLCLGLAIAFYALKGSYFARSITIQFNNQQNNSLFQYVDSLVPGGVLGDGGSRNDYISRASNALNSDAFIDFILIQAKTDSQVAKMINYDKATALAGGDPGELKKAVRTEFFSKVKFNAADIPGADILRVKGNGFFFVSLTDLHAEWVEEMTQPLAELVSDFLAKREVGDINATRALIFEKLRTYRAEIDDFVKQSITIQRDTPTVTAETYQTVEFALQTTKMAMLGNTAMESRYSGTIKDIEDKLVSLGKTPAANEAVRTQRELLGLSYQKNAQVEQGVEDQSTPSSEVNQQLKLASEKLERLAAKGKLGTATISQALGDDYVSRANELGQFVNSLKGLKEETAFYKNKISALDAMLADLKEQINRKLASEVKRNNFEREIAAREKLIDNLQTSLIRLDLADFKIVKRLEIFPGEIYETGSASIKTLLILSILAGLFSGIIIAFTCERKNPGLRTIADFEEMGVPVVGAVPKIKRLIVAHASASDNDPDVLSYVRLAINLGNILTYMKSKICLITGAHSSDQSASITLNLAACFARMGRKVLIIETDIRTNSLSKLTGINFSSGLERVVTNADNVTICPHGIEANLELLNGSGANLPPLFRVANENFLTLLEELSREYDYIFVHSRPCLEGPTAADLSRYAGTALICCDAKQVRIANLERLVTEMSLFLSKYSYFVVEDVEDSVAQYHRSEAKAASVTAAETEITKLEKAS